MHACPCCGYRTLPGRADYDLCPVCWWEDDGSRPWEVSGPNGWSLVEAQQAYLAETRPYRRRSGKVRPPRATEARDPGWRPFELTDDLVARLEKAKQADLDAWRADHHRIADEIAKNPEGPFKEYNAAVRALRSAADELSHREVKARMESIGLEHDITLPDAYVELRSRLLKDQNFYRRHPVHAVVWLLRHGRPGTYKRRWHEWWTGNFRFIG